jgi:membrane-bound serine protease (ClpP class)
MNPALIAALYVVGLALVAAEVVMPGVVVGLLGLGCLGAAVYSTFQYGLVPGIVGLASTVGFVGATGLYAVRRLTHRKTLDAARGYASTDPGLVDLHGAEGVAATPLRPSGFASFEGRRVSVVTRGEFIDPDARVRVIEVEGGRVVVRRA